MFRPTTMAALGLLATCASATAAVTIIDTIDPTYGTAGAGGSADNGFTFTTGVLGTDTKLDTITIATPTGSNNARLFTLQLFAHTGTTSSEWSPGTLLGTSDVQTFDSDNGPTSTFTFNLLPELDDNTIYVIRYANPDGTAASGFRYVGVLNNTEQSKVETGGQIFNGGAPIFDRGAPIEVTMVPEPASLSLLGLAGFGLLVRRRRA